MFPEPVMYLQVYCTMHATWLSFLYGLSFLAESDRKEVIAAIEEAKTFISTDSPSESTEQEPPKKRQKQKGGLMALLEDIVSDSAVSSTRDPQQVASTEIQKYLCIDSDPGQKSLVEELSLPVSTSCEDGTEVFVHTGHICAIRKSF